MTLAVRDVVVRFGRNTVLDGVRFCVGDGMTAVVGPNGSGKSTLLRTLAGILQPAAGTVELHGEPLRSHSRAQIARTLAMVGQSAPVPAAITVREHVLFGRKPYLRRFHGPTQGDYEAVDEAIEQCGIAKLQNRRVDALSGGERQRVRIATALAQEPKILLLDEPMAGLDIEHQLELLQILQSMHAERGVAIVAVLHDLDLAMDVFDRIAVMHNGALHADGPPEAVLTPELFQRVFGVQGAVEQYDGRRVVVCQRMGTVCPHSVAQLQSVSL